MKEKQIIEVLDNLINKEINFDEARDKLFVLYGVSGSTCKEHKPMNKVMGYVEWQEWADLKTRRGHIQRQCKKCGKWLFKCEQ